MKYYIIHFPDKATALLVLHYAQKEAENRLSTSLVEAPKVLQFTKDMIHEVKAGGF